MTTTAGRALAAALAAALLLSGCSSTHTAAPPAPAPSSTAADGGADVAQLDTGPYPTTPGPPAGDAGDNPMARALLESQRIAEVTVGPWQVDRTLTLRGEVLFTAATSRVPDAGVMRDAKVLPDALPGIAERNGLMAGFSSLRTGPANNGRDPQQRFIWLQTVVLRFPDPAAAAAAARQMADADPGPEDAAGPRRAVTLGGGETAALAAAWPLGGGMEQVRSFTADGPFVLYQSGTGIADALGPLAATLVMAALGDQKKLLATFTPTPADTLAALPFDPSGSLYARTLSNPAGSDLAMIGVWQPTAWLHFEDAPLTAATVFDETGVDWVSARLATVYRTRNADAAEQLLQYLVTQMRGTAPAKPTAAVPGLPRARCFERASVEALRDVPEDWQRVNWRFKCAASTDRYVFAVTSADGSDAMQRISAQYRILAGR